MCVCTDVCMYVSRQTDECVDGWMHARMQHERAHAKLGCRLGPVGTGMQNGNHFVDAVRAAVKDEGAEVLVIGAKIEADITELETYEERQMFLDELDLDEPGVNRLIRSAYSLLNLQTYFTAGAKEVRAWTVKKGASAPEAAGVIHTDFEKGFIRAEVISFKDYSEYKSEIKVKEAGKLNIEGKEYVVNDGDVMHFRFNV